MFWQIVQAFIRHSLTSVGAVIVTKGLASQSDDDQAIGAIMLLVGICHSIYVKWSASKATSTSSTSSSVPIKMLSVAFIAASLLMLMPGCKSTPQEITYQAASTTVIGVDTAMTLWGNYVAQAHPGTNQEMIVKNAYEKYQASMAAVCDAGEIYAATGGTNGTATAAFNQAIANSGQDLTDLENLLISLGIKLQ